MELSVKKNYAWLEVLIDLIYPKEKTRRFQFVIEIFFWHSV